MSLDYVNKKKDNYVKVVNNSYNTEFLASSIFVYFNINGKRSHLPLNKLIKQFENLKKGDKWYYLVRLLLIIRNGNKT